MLDPRVSRFLRLLTVNGAPGNGSTGSGTATVQERRGALAELMKLGGQAPATAGRDHGLPGPAGRIGIRIHDATGVAGGLSPGLIYFHGGGLVAGSLDTHDAIAGTLAAAGGCRVVSVDYRLAPEHPFPAAFEDALAATEHLTQHAAEFGMDPARIGICGDSAGGALAAAVCHAMAAAGGTRLALQVLLCPILDYGGESPSRRELASGYLIDEATLAHDLRCCLREADDAADPRLSPLRFPSLANVPPTILHTAEYDPLRDEAGDYAARLSAAGCRVTHTCHAGMIHLFYGLGAVIPYARRAWEQIGAEIRAQLVPRP